MLANATKEPGRPRTRATDAPAVGIAGSGAVSAAGDGVPATLESFRTGRVNPAKVLPFESSINCPTFQVAAELPGIAPPAGGSRTVRLMMHALLEATVESDMDDLSDVRVGVCLGTTVASQLNNVPFYEAYRSTKHPPLDAVHEYLAANLASAVGDVCDWQGPRLTVVNACSSGTDAIGIAATWIRAGLCDVAIAGGADELNRVAMAGFWSLGVMSSQLCRPFDRDRAGLNLGEGAGVVILESAAHAARRGKTHAFEIAGFGSACDAHHLTAPHPEGRGLQAAIRAALTQANITPGQVAFINAHGTATLDNDRAESTVIEKLFGTGTPFLSTKGFTGHTLGAAGGLEAVFTVLGLREQWIPASAGFEHRDDALPLAPVRERTPITGEYALSTSLAFGGNNAAVLIRRRS
ncbi:beta-ketoacyl-[acyl-carrier-protein] synthase family protein [soil metagenome]